MSEHACAVCGRPEPFGVNLCAQCGASSDADDALIFVRDTAGADGRRDAESRLAAVVGDAQLPRAARGKQALLRLPRSLVPRVIERLETVGLSARVVPVVRAWSAMPSHFFVLLGAILVTGALAGRGPLPSMAWTTPLMATLLLVVAQRAMTRPALGNARHEPRLPGPAARAARHAFADMSSGAPRDRLADVVRVAQPVFAGAPRALGRLLSDLVVAACATALETQRQAAVLDVLDEHDGSPHLGDAAARCERSRNDGLELLRRTAAAVARLGATHSLGEPDTQHEPLAELVRELEREAEAQAETARDLEALMASPHGARIAGS